MKLTPLDIHHKEFRHSVKGYNEQQVDDFLDEVADEFERLFKENISLSEKLDAANERVKQYQDMEQTLRNTMMAAQSSGDQMMEKAKAESADVRRDADLKAKEIIHNALNQKQQVANELARIKQAEEDFRTSFRTVLEKYLANLAEVRLPDDVRVMIGQTDEGVVGSVQVAAEAPPAGAPVQEELPAEGPVELETLTPAEPPQSGFVAGVQLGEMESPDLGPDTTMGEPKEFTLPNFGGEREDDVDIEEID